MTNKITEKKYCVGCGAELHASATQCPKCGAELSTEGEKSKIMTGVLALLLGHLGIHRFYLGQWVGIFYLLFVWTFIPTIVAVIEGIYFLVMSEDKFNQKYNR